MNREEYTKLSSQFISHEARSLYLFCIKAGMNSLGEFTIDYTKLIHDLTIYDYTSSGVIIFKPSSDQITQYLNELFAFNLISCVAQAQNTQNHHGATIKVMSMQNNPELITEDKLEKLQKRYPMHPDWLPSANFLTTAKNAMLINARYSEQELANFKTFWIANGAIFNESEWDYRLVSYLKKIHVKTSFSVPISSQNIGLQNK